MSSPDPRPKPGPTIDFRFSSTARAFILAEIWKKEDRKRREAGPSRHPPIEGPVVLAVAAPVRPMLDKGRFRFEGGEPANYRLVVSHGLMARFSSEKLARDYAARFGGFAYVASATELGTGELGWTDVTE